MSQFDYYRAQLLTLANQPQEVKVKLNTFAALDAAAKKLLTAFPDLEKQQKGEQQIKEDTALIQQAIQ